MESKFKIIAKVPTHHTIGDLRSAFNMPTKQHGNGAFTASEEFETINEAKKYLIERLDRYRDHSDMTDEKYNDQLENIENREYLRLSGITAHIEELEENED